MKAAVTGRWLLCALAALCLTGRCPVRAETAPASRAAVASPNADVAPGEWVRSTWERLRAWSSETFEKLKPDAKSQETASGDGKAAVSSNRPEAQRTVAPERTPAVEGLDAPVAERLLRRDGPAPWRDGVSVGRVPVPGEHAAPGEPALLQRLPAVADEERPATVAASSCPVATDTSQLERLPPVGDPPVTEPPDVVKDDHVELPAEASVALRHGGEQPAALDSAESDSEACDGPRALDRSGTGGLIVATPGLLAEAGLRPSAALLAAPEFPVGSLSILQPLVRSRPTVFPPLRPCHRLTAMRDVVAPPPPGKRVGPKRMSDFACRPYARQLHSQRPASATVCRVDDGPAWPRAGMPVVVQPPQPRPRAACGLALLGVPGCENAEFRLFAYRRRADSAQDTIQRTSHQAMADAGDDAVRWAAGTDPASVAAIAETPARDRMRAVPPPAKAWSGRLLRAWQSATTAPEPQRMTVVSHRRVCPIDLDRIGAIPVLEDVGELVVSLRENRLLRTNVEVRRVTVDDAAVCEAIQLGPNDVSLVARSAGTTFAHFWYAGDERPVTYLINVPPHSNTHR